jgi:hypothetical protein
LTSPCFSGIIPSNKTFWRNYGLQKYENQLHLC